MGEQSKLPCVVSLAVFLGLSAGIFVWRPDPSVEGSWATAESGFIQMASAASWLIAAAVCLTVAVWAQYARLDWFLGGVILVLFGLRELDIQKWFTDWNIGTPSNYWNPHISLSERLMFLGFFTLPSCLLILTFVVRMGGPFCRAWREGARWTWDVIIWGVMLALTAVLDKFHHVMPVLGFDLSYKYIFVVLEETLELVLGLYTVLFLTSLWQWKIWRKSARAANVTS